MLINLNEVQALPPHLPNLPMGLIQQARFTIKPGGYDKDKFLTQAPNGSLFLNGQFTILKGQYARHVISQQIGIEGEAPDGCDADLWNLSHSFLRALWESSQGIQPSDNSYLATMTRRIVSFKEIDDILCILQIGVKLDDEGKIIGLSNIVRPITPDHPLYAQVKEDSTDHFYGFVGESIFICSKTQLRPAEAGGL